MPTQLPALQPFKPQMPDLAQSIQQGDINRQRAATVESNLRGAGIQQQRGLQSIEAGEEARRKSKVQQLGMALQNVNSKESFMQSLGVMLAQTPPEEQQEAEDALERIFPNLEYDPGRVEAVKSMAGIQPQEAKTPSTFSKKNADGSVRTIKNVLPGSEQAIKLQSQGFVRGTQTVGVKPTAEERKESRLIKNVDKLSGMAAADPNKFFEEQNFRQNPDGSLFLDPVSEAPQRLKPFYTATGKRGNIKAMISLGEMWDDSKELSELMGLPSVKKNLQQANSDGLWDQATGKWSNAIKKWMQNRGIGGDSPTATAIARIQRMGSEERRSFAGTAVTQTELESILAWLPSAGDSYEQIINKTRLMGQEAEQAFRRQMDIFGEESDMSPFYKAFGINRFPTEEENVDAAAEAFLNQLGGQ